MILPPRVPVVWQMYAGDESAITITLKQEGQPLVLPTTGWYSEWRKTRDSLRSVVIEVDTSEAEFGRLILRLNSEKTRLVIGHGVYDLERPDIARTYLYGTTSCLEDVSRSVNPN